MLHFEKVTVAFVSKIFLHFLRKFNSFQIEIPQRQFPHDFMEFDMDYQ